MGIICKILGHKWLTNTEVSEGTYCKRCHYTDLSVMFPRNSKGFHVIDISQMSAEQLLSFITPFIEESGYTWEYDGITLRIK